MLKLNQFIALRAIFNDNLADAILNKDLNQIDEIVNHEYAEEIAEGFVIMEAIDTEWLYNDYQAAQNESFDWAL